MNQDKADKNHVLDTITIIVTQMTTISLTKDR